jgi:hypothetical protein
MAGGGNRDEFCQALDETEDEGADDGLVCHERSLRVEEDRHESKRICGERPDSLVFVPPNFYRFVKSAVAKSVPHEAAGPARPLPQSE